jgi:two-component system chemotaxis response regulator CheB
MLCDDSATVRAALMRILAADPGIRVVARAADGRDALAQQAALPAADKPQVVLLDLEMPVMDGMTVLPRLLAADPALVVIVASALSQRGARATMQALAAGAKDYIPKPSATEGGVRDPHFQADLLAKVKGWARMGRGPSVAPVTRTLMVPLARAPLAGGRPRAIAIGCSTGGPQALAALVGRLTQPPPVPILVVQHMPAGFTTLLAEHLHRLGRLPCHEATDGVALRPGELYLAPGDRHLVVEEGPGGLTGHLNQDAPENFCRPAVDPMLRSLVKAVGGRLVVAILTGMGQDGLAGCRAAAAAGGTILAQDEASSVVWGMPGAVARAGLAAALLPVEDIAARLQASVGSVAA